MTDWIGEYDLNWGEEPFEAFCEREPGMRRGGIGDADVRIEIDACVVFIFDGRLGREICWRRGRGEDVGVDKAAF